MSSQQPEIDPIQLVQDATAFAESSFGKHYLRRLHQLKAYALEQTMNLELTDKQRANAGTIAHVYQDEIAYFRIAASVKNDPNLFDRIKAKVKSRKEAQQEQEV